MGSQTATPTTPAAAPAMTTAVARGGPWWAAWADLISFRPSTAIQGTLKSRSRSWKSQSSTWYVHKLEDAAGDINIDVYPVRVSRTPTSMSAERLLEYVRTHINDFVDPAYSRFVPYDEKYPPATAGDKARWLSSNPESAVISINMRMGGIYLPTGDIFPPPGGPTKAYLNPDDGSVVCAQKETNFWIFSTIYTDEDKGHPVSGNRQFGFIQDPEGGYVFFTRGADRATSLVDDFPLAPVFTMADLLWKSFQEKLTNYVNNNGGSATTSSEISKRVYWPVVKVVAWHPTVPWI